MYLYTLKYTVKFVFDLIKLTWDNYFHVSCLSILSCLPSFSLILLFFEAVTTKCSSFFLQAHFHIIFYFAFLSTSFTSQVVLLNEEIQLTLDFEIKLKLFLN